MWDEWLNIQVRVGVRLNQGWRLKVPASLASETTPDDSAFVPRLSSLLFGGDVETAVVMAARRKLCYIELILEQSEALQGNWEVIRLCYKVGYQSSACVSLQGLSAHTHVIRTAHVIFIFYT